MAFKGGSPVSDTNRYPIKNDDLGAPADAVWNGTGSGTVISILKALWATFGGVLQMVSAAPAAAQTVGIGTGASITNAIDLNDQRLHRIMVPAGTPGWTAAAITFQTSPDGTGNWSDLWFNDAEVAIAASSIPTTGGRAFVVDPAVFLGVRYLKIRSGTAAVPVNQVAARTLTLVTVAR